MLSQQIDWNTPDLQAELTTASILVQAENDRIADPRRRRRRFNWLGEPSSNEIALGEAKHLIYHTQHTWNVKCEKETEMIDLCERWKNMNDNERREQLRTTIGFDRMAEFDVSEMDLDYYYDAESAFYTFYVIDGYLLMDDKDSNDRMNCYMQELEIIQGSAAAEEKLNKILPECIVQIILNHMSVPAEDMWD